MRRVVLGFGLSAVVLVGLAVAVDWRKLLGELGRADLVVFAAGPTAILLALMAWTEGQRRMLLASDVELSHFQTFLPMCAGTFLRLIVPMGNVGGPAIITYAIGKQSGRSYEEDLAPVSIGEMTSLVASLLVGAVGILLFFGTNAPTRAVRTLQLGLVALGVVVMGSIVMLWRRQSYVESGIVLLASLGRQTVGRLSERVRRALARDSVMARIHRFFESFDAISDQRGTIAVAFCFYLAGWTLFTVPLYTSFWALGHPISIEFVLFLVPASGVANIFPVPGGTGAVEGILTLIINQLVGLSESSAAAVAILYQASAYWFMLLVAGVGSAILSMRLQAES